LVCDPADAARGSKWRWVTGDGAGCLQSAYSSNDSVMTVDETTAMLRARRLMLEDNAEAGVELAAMKIMTILGTRPEIIRLSLVIPLLDRFCQHVLVHTGQNYDDRLSQVFFDELGVRKPDVHMGVRASSFGGQIGQILEQSEACFLNIARPAADSRRHQQRIGRHHRATPRDPRLPHGGRQPVL
jgi:hypothetical protein